MSFIKRENWLAYVLVGPVLLFYAVIFVYPLLQMLLLSFQSYDFYTPPEFTGLDNYARLLGDRELLAKLGYTLFYWLIGPITIAASFVTALLLSKLNRGQAFFRSAFYGTSMAPMVALAVVFMYLFSPNHGIVNNVLTDLHLPAVEWLYEPLLAKTVVMSIFFFMNMGFYTILFLSGILGVDQSLYAAASLDGAGRWRQVWHITLPQIRPVMIFATILMTISIFQMYGQIVILTKGGPFGSTETVFMYAMNKAFTDHQMGYAATIVVVLSALLGLISYGILKIGEEKE
ncbi:sugar ABC transporter permease [Cohnella sp. LGH]|uniref:Multiple sugar transport system permease protein/lactose/L-arabinose transport system permease protein n=1 Tax=Cohnella phaseoli TaxID=456490 RepID=A0A3D9IRJ5_9BACL|nr:MULTISPECIES: sugar ABC transporter permease [Cohnella]QTH40097.1 sugar ABC transporter permease [Cohnella sp. LGH]RED64393.1 multiple sugar transport system permease protein/lactose/L-arabinose transport system permease protein [Cohnella phaseoli]